MGKGPNDRGLSRHYIVAECERSLKRLKTDWIDLYQVHQWDGMTPLEETMEALDRLDPAGQGPLHRLLQLLRLAHHEGARRRSEGRPPAVRQPADPLHAAGARGGIRAGADLARPGTRHPGVEPDRRRAAVRQVHPQEHQGAEGHPPLRPQMARAADLRRGARCFDIIDVLARRRQGSTSVPPRGSRWPGCSTSRA